MHHLGESYHVYNRGAHKSPIFLEKSDYTRFIRTLYAANDTDSLKERWFEYPGWDFPTENRKPLVEIFAYCLMPNHFHLALTEISERGIERFMRKLCTSYGMYFNHKYSHSGTIFQSKCKSKHIDNDDYVRYLIEYIHLNPFGIEEPDLLRSAKSEFKDKAVLYSKKYDFSSFKDYLGEKRPQSVLLTYR